MYSHKSLIWYNEHISFTLVQITIYTVEANITRLVYWLSLTIDADFKSVRNTRLSALFLSGFYLVCRKVINYFKVVAAYT